MSNFADSTGAFFSELSKIIEKQQAVKEEGMDLRSDRPFSSVLTQDDEPSTDLSPLQLDWQEPEVVTRSMS